MPCTRKGHRTLHRRRLRSPQQVRPHLRRFVFTTRRAVERREKDKATTPEDAICLKKQGSYQFTNSGRPREKWVLVGPKFDDFNSSTSCRCQDSALLLMQQGMEIAISHYTLRAGNDSEKPSPWPSCETTGPAPPTAHESLSRTHFPVAVLELSLS